MRLARKNISFCAIALTKNADPTLSTACAAVAVADAVAVAAAVAVPAATTANAVAAAPAAGVLVVAWLLNAMYG